MFIPVKGNGNDLWFHSTIHLQSYHFRLVSVWEPNTRGPHTGLIVHSHYPIPIQIKCPIPIILLYIPVETHITIGSRIGIGSVSVNTLLDCTGTDIMLKCRYRYNLGCSMKTSTKANFSPVLLAVHFCVNKPHVKANSCNVYPAARFLCFGVYYL